MGMNTSTIHRWLNDGFIAGSKSPGAPWQIRINDELRARIVGGAAGYLPMLETTLKLRVSQQTVLRRVKRGELEAVLVTQGRRKACESKSWISSRHCSNNFHEPGGSMKPYPVALESASSPPDTRPVNDRVFSSAWCADAPVGTIRAIQKVRFQIGSDQQGCHLHHPVTTVRIPNGLSHSPSV
jgi:hypothetical protein